MRQGAFAAGFILLCSAAIFGQSTNASLTFEVASVKTAPPLTIQSGVPHIGMGGGPGTNDPERFSFDYVNLKTILVSAFGVKNLQISGPAWLDTINNERYNIA